MSIRAESSEKAHDDMIISIAEEILLVVRKHTTDKTATRVQIGVALNVAASLYKAAEYGGVEDFNALNASIHRESVLAG